MPVGVRIQWAELVVPKTVHSGRGGVIPFKVFVGNLNYETTRAELETLFTEVGELVEVFLPTDRNTGRPRGFAFVEFKEEATLTAAIEKFNGHEHRGRAMRVDRAADRPPRRSGFAPDGGGPGDFGGGGGWEGGKTKGSRRNIRGSKRSL